MRHFKYEVVGGKHSGKTGRLLSTHKTKTNAKKSAKKYQQKGYHGMIWTRKKVTPGIRKKMRRYGAKGRYYYTGDSRKGDDF